MLLVLKARGLLLAVVSYSWQGVLGAAASCRTLLWGHGGEGTL